VRSSENAKPVRSPAIARAPTCLLSLGVADLFHRRAVGPQPVGDDDLRAAIALHRFLDELQRRGLVTGLGDEGFQHFAFVIHRPPQVVELAIDLHVDLVQVPAPLSDLAHLRAALPADLRGEHRTEPVPPVAHRLVAEVDPALEQ
jgi:hypothetical protein